MTSPNEAKVWFPAKKYGWGWGFPRCWQGWIVLWIWITAFSSGLFLIPEHPGLFVAYAGTLTLILMGICYLKGEKPGWRWGKD